MNIETIKRCARSGLEILAKFSITSFVQATAPLIFAIASTSLANAADLIVDASGILHGAHNVNVSGLYYDVVFREGSFASIYGGSSSNFDVPTEVEARGFSNALLEQVFIDGPVGSFDSNPALTFGCADIRFCGAITPFLAVVKTDSLVSGVAFNNNGDLGYLDYTATIQSLLTLEFDSSDATNAVFADWESTDAPAVPIPGSAWLFGSGLIGLTRIKKLKWKM